MADVDAPFVKQIFDLPQGERKSNPQHHRKTDDLGRCLGVFEMVFHSETLDGILPTLNAVSSDNAKFCANEAPPWLDRFGGVSCS